MYSHWTSISGLVINPFSLCMQHFSGYHCFKWTQQIFFANLFLMKLTSQRNMDGHNCYKSFLFFNIKYCWKPVNECRITSLNSPKLISGSWQDWFNPLMLLTYDSEKLVVYAPVKSQWSERHASIFIFFVYFQKRSRDITLQILKWVCNCLQAGYYNLFTIIQLLGEDRNCVPSVW